MNTLELDREQAVALPDREALSRFRLNLNFALVSANSTATAVNAVTLLSAATAVSGNVISISQ